MLKYFSKSHLNLPALCVPPFSHFSEAWVDNETTQWKKKKKSTVLTARNAYCKYKEETCCPFDLLLQIYAMESLSVSNT